MRYVIKAIASLAGLALGFVVLLTVTHAIQVMSGAPQRPSPFALIGAIVIAVAAWRRAPAPETVRAWFKSPMLWARLLSQETRLAVAVAVPWMLSVWLATYPLRLFNGYNAAPRYYALLLLPPVIFFIAAKLLRWAVKPVQRVEGDGSARDRAISASVR